MYVWFRNLQLFIVHIILLLKSVLPFRNITETLNSHKLPEKKDLEACDKLIYKLSGLDAELVATAQETWKAINSKVTELFVIEKKLQKQEQG